MIKNYQTNLVYTFEAFCEQRTHFGVEQLLQVRVLQLRIAARVALVFSARRLPGQWLEGGEVGRELESGRDPRANGGRRGEVARG